MKTFVCATLIVALAVLNGCTKKTETEKIDLDNDDAMEETLTNAMEDPSIAIQQPPQALTDVSQGSPASEVSIPENPTPQQIQQALKNAGLYNGSVDGVVGSRTKKAIEEFQAQNNLKADGKVGPKTWGTLGPYLNRPLPSTEAETPATPVAIQ